MRLERYYDSIFASVAAPYSTIFRNKILFMELIPFLNYNFSKTICLETKRNLKFDEYVEAS